ncbi:MAG: CHAT domain-containing protein [Haliscomenobacter sp.]|uniref:CHAT domain-containing protein n=1 Tax=Haliscomenobacter sp. TaxID=2717303 RepID=UPI0029BE60E6|nr:CHAT domain-containing protein [Haliscomenobacter sp.]MDX2072555.1 CHAT domain-containing protein [Haliscomenobacter sp.]
MPQTRPVILTAFANSHDEGYLVYLEKERDRIQETFETLSYIQHVDLPNAKTQQLVDKLTTFKSELLILHFGGHADGSQLQFSDTGGQAIGLAENLSLHPQLRLLFLNGCNTQAQVLKYQAVGIPVIIATTCPVADGQAMRFATHFYQALANDHTIQEAFTRAKGAAKLQTEESHREEIIFHRGLRLREEQVIEMPWRLYAHTEANLNWKLADMQKELPVTANYLDQQQIQGYHNNALKEIHHSQVSITNNYGLAPPPSPIMPQDEFVMMLSKLSYQQSPPPEFYLVNCDRTLQLLEMQDHIEKAPRHQFYFILSCPSQHPHSLVQRFIFDIRDAFGKAADQQIDYRRTKDFEGARRIDVQHLEAGRKLDWLQQDWLSQWKNPDQLDFGSFIESQLPQLNYQYLATAYEFYSRDWPLQRLKPLLFEWMQAFSSAYSSGPQCLFFFIINIRSIHCIDPLSVKEGELAQFIRDLATSNAEQVLLIDSLPQVEVEDVQTWLDKMFREGERRALLNMWWKQKGANVNFKPSDLLDMDEVFTFMKELWNHGRHTTKPN